MPLRRDGNYKFKFDSKEKEIFKLSVKVLAKIPILAKILFCFTMYRVVPFDSSQPQLYEFIRIIYFVGSSQFTNSL